MNEKIKDMEDREINTNLINPVYELGDKVIMFVYGDYDFNNEPEEVFITSYGDIKRINLSSALKFSPYSQIRTPDRNLSLETQYLET